MDGLLALIKRILYKLSQHVDRGVGDGCQAVGCDKPMKAI